MNTRIIFSLFLVLFSNILLAGKSEEHAERRRMSRPNGRPEAIHYNYFEDKFVQSVVDSGSRYVLVGTGWSESSLGKMNTNNQEKQKRALALSMAQLMRVEQLGGKGELIYLTTSPISSAYLRYLYRIANQRSVANLSDEEFEARFKTFDKRFLRMVYLSPKGRMKDPEDRTKYLQSNRNSYRRIKVPKALISLQHNKFTPSTMVGFTAHFSGPYLEQLAKEWDLPYLVNPSSQAHWIKKSKSRESFRDAGVRHPKGTYEPAFSVDALVNDIYALLQQITTGKIILKLDQSAAGYGNKVMRFDDITPNLTESEAKAIIRKRFDDKEIFPEIFLGRIEEEDGGAIIEEFIDCKNYASPASIFMINGENDVSVQYTYDQLLGGKDNMVFQGSLGPIIMPPNEEGDINAMSKKVGEFLSTQGVRGNVGTDFVVCDMDDKGVNRIAYAIENNVRMTGTSYPYYTLRTMLGEKRMKRKFMKSFDDVHVPKITRYSLRQKLNRELFMTFLKDNPDNLDLVKGKGCLVHNDTTKIGKIGIACIANKKTDVVKMYDRFIDSIVNYVTNHEITKEASKPVQP